MNATTMDLNNLLQQKSGYSRPQSNTIIHSFRVIDDIVVYNHFAIQYFKFKVYRFLSNINAIELIRSP